MNKLNDLKVRPFNIGKTLEDCKKCSKFVKLTENSLVLCNRIKGRNVVVIPAPAFYLGGLENGVMAVRCSELC